MKIISEYEELKGKTFSTIKQCAEEEARIDALRAESAKKDLSNQKKQYANAIEAADKKVKEAYDNYETAKKKVREILEESNKQMTDLISDAANKIKEAESERKGAILDYTSKFGIYQKVYTGDRAIEEYARFEKSLSNDWGNLVNKFLGIN